MCKTETGAICLDKIEMDFVILRCGHPFHNNCIKGWMKNNRSQFLGQDSLSGNDQQADLVFSDYEHGQLLAVTSESFLFYYLKITSFF